MLIMSNQHSKKLFVVEAAEELPSTANPMCCFLLSWSWRLMSLLSCFQVLATSAILGGAAGGESFSFVLGKTWLCHHFFPTQFPPFLRVQDLLHLAANLWGGPHCAQCCRHRAGKNEFADRPSLRTSSSRQVPGPARRRWLNRKTTILIVPLRD